MATTRELARLKSKRLKLHRRYHRLKSMIQLYENCKNMSIMAGIVLLIALVLSGIIYNNLGALVWAVFSLVMTLCLGITFSSKKWSCQDKLTITRKKILASCAGRLIRLLQRELAIDAHVPNNALSRLTGENDRLVAERGLSVATTIQAGA